MSLYFWKVVMFLGHTGIWSLQILHSENPRNDEQSCVDFRSRKTMMIRNMKVKDLFTF